MHKDERHIKTKDTQTQLKKQWSNIHKYIHMYIQTQLVEPRPQMDPGPQRHEPGHTDPQKFTDTDSTDT